MCNKWSNEEIELLKAKFPICNINELLLLFPNRNKNAINLKANKLGIHKETIKRTIFFSMFLNSFFIHILLLDSNIILSNPSIYKIHFKKV